MRSLGLLTVTACAAAILSAAAGGTIWPDQVGTYKKASSEAVEVKDKPLWDEYGLEQAERAEYTAGAKRFTATAYRMKDPTGAFGAFEWQRPAGSRPLQLTEVGVETGDGALLIFGNYLVRFEGWKPAAADLEPVLPRFPKLDQSPLPTSCLPSVAMVPDSQRYAIGPAGLEAFEPGVPPSVAAFSMGAEVQVAKYRSDTGEMQMAVFSYPNPQIARQRLPEFQKLPGAMAKRSGALVALILSPKSSDAAERLLSSVKWNVVITEDERIPTRRDNIGDLVWNAFILIGFILILFVAAGIVVGILRRLRVGMSDEAMTVLHLEDRGAPPQAPPGQADRA